MRKLCVVLVSAISLVFVVQSGYGQDKIDEPLAKGNGCEFNNTSSEITFPSNSNSINKSQTQLFQTIDSSTSVEQLCLRDPQWALKVSEQAIRKVYDAHREAYIRQSSYKLVSEQDVKLNGRLGRELVFIMPDGTQLLMRTYLNGEYYVRVSVYIKDPEKADAAGVKKAMAIIDSVRLL